MLLLPLRSRRAVEARLTAENEALTNLVGTLSKKNLELDERVRFKTDLMNMLGHEIRNPLTSVLGFSQIGLAAASEQDSDGARAAMLFVERNARKVADVLTDVRHLVASERGVLVAAPEVVALEPRLRSAIEDRPRQDRPKLHCPPDLNVRVQPGHLDQIIANLLENAAKYAGGAKAITVHTRPDRSSVGVSVVDSGPGVPEGSQGRLFDRYWRDAATARTVPGTGIGLFISRELARANGGDLVHEHAEPSGSRFTLTLAREHEGATTD
ncbi:sensor histidine kinase [Marmoricola sp. RAF53]|uniref:sensor histidine kinase n=1 Tax=Marmoricola sp. RAF53 TaxID=3233059 RepID=UPI003F9CA642